MAKAQEHGIKFDKTLEIREKDGFSSAVEYELASITNADNGSVLQFSTSNKPTRPGRGRAKVAKFVCDS